MPRQAQDNPLLTPLMSHCGRRKPARTNSMTISSARYLQASFRRASFASRARSRAHNKVPRQRWLVYFLYDAPGEVQETLPMSGNNRTKELFHEQRVRINNGQKPAGERTKLRVHGLYRRRTLEAALRADRCCSRTLEAVLRADLCVRFKNERTRLVAAADSAATHVQKSFIINGSAQICS